MSHPWWWFGIMVAHCSRSMYMYVTLRRARLVLGWVTVARFKFCRTILVFNQIPRPNQLGIPLWVGKKSTDWYFTLYWAFCTREYLTVYSHINRVITHMLYM